MMQMQRPILPGQPWTYRADWAAGRIPSRRTIPVLGWALAIPWNVMIWFWIAALWQSARGLQLPQIFALSLFAAIGTGLLVWVIPTTLRRWRFGQSAFEMSVVPAALGGTLQGQIQAIFPQPPVAGVTLRLICIQRQRGSDGERQNSLLWQTESTVPPEQLPVTAVSCSIPVAFPIPADALESSSSERIHWILVASAIFPGLNYLEEFEVPVFRTKASPPRSSPEAFRAPDPVVEALPATSKIRVRPLPSGATEYYFPAARNTGPATVATLVLAGWTGVVWVIYKVAPRPLALFFGLLDIPVLLFAMKLWFEVSSVRIESDEMILCKGILTPYRCRRIPLNQIDQFKTTVGMRTSGETGHTWYDVSVTLKQQGSSAIALAGNLAAKREADWIVLQLSQQAGLSAVKKP